jgi:hypothetical protein
VQTSDLVRIAKMAMLYFAVRIFFVALHFDWDLRVIRPHLGDYLFETLIFVLISEIVTRVERLRRR